MVGIRSPIFFPWEQVCLFSRVKWLLAFREGAPSVPWKHLDGSTCHMCQALGESKGWRSTSDWASWRKAWTPLVLMKLASFIVLNPRLMATRNPANSPVEGKALEIYHYLRQVFKHHPNGGAVCLGFLTSINSVFDAPCCDCAEIL